MTKLRNTKMKKTITKIGLSNNKRLHIPLPESFKGY